VGDAVLMGRYAAIGHGHRPTAADETCVRDALTQVGMPPFLARQIGTLAGSPQQRVFLARALAPEADPLILD